MYKILKEILFHFFFSERKFSASHAEMAKFFVLSSERALNADFLNVISIQLINFLQYHLPFIAN